MLKFQGGVKKRQSPDFRPLCRVPLSLPASQVNNRSSTFLMYPRIKYHTGGDDCKLVNPPPPLFSNSDMRFLLNQRSFTRTPTPPPPILMGFSEGKLCSDSFIHVVFLKRMSKIVLVSTLILLIFFFIFSSFQFMLVFT